MPDYLSLFQLAGGLGIFLVGMIVMTEALRALAGDSLRRALFTFTRSPASGALTGSLCTAVLQSSSATTVAAVGFVGAGLMSFPSALGIVFGANLGTTITGWIVALLGFKMNLIALMYPLMLLGAVMRLFLSGRAAYAGLAVAGFGLVFVGIDQMQQGMSSMHDLLLRLDLPTDSWWGRMRLLLLGMVFTILTQSSSAGVAAVLTALFTDTITLAQGLSLVIGMDVGTTITAVLATIGGSAQVQRTGYSHFVYNVMTAIGAFLLLLPYVHFWERYAPQQIGENAEFILVGFHTAFNLVGVLLVLPFASQFARLMEKLVPERAGGYTAALDTALLADPGMALTALRVTTQQEFAALVRKVRALLLGAGCAVDMLDLQRALDETHRFADDINLGQNHERRRELEAYIHILDHLQRLHERCEEDADRARAARETPELEQPSHRLQEVCDLVLQQRDEEDTSRLVLEATLMQEEFERGAGSLRGAIIQRVADGDWDVEHATRALEAIRWIRRVGNHIAHISGRLNAAAEDGAAPPSPRRSGLRSGDP